MKYCSAANKQRVLQKFVENDHEKVDRLIEIYFKYLEKVNQVDEMIKKEKEEVNL
jgi:beta-catenin-like protein 1